jgi:hypothetical protein
MRKVILGVVALSALFAGQSFAATIDFRQPIWNPHGGNPKTVGGVTALALDGNAVDIELFWSTQDGFGIDSGGNDREHDEINNNERLVITFATPFVLTGVMLTDLFNETLNGVNYDEIAEYRINGGEWEDVSGVDNRHQNPNGEVFFQPFGIFAVTTLEFRADTLDPGGLRNDFAVARLEGYSAVPEPTSMLLSGSGLIGLAARFRRKRSA